MGNIKIKVAKWGLKTYEGILGCVKTIDCSFVTTKGTFWYTPQSNSDGTFAGWKRTSTKPSSDSFKVVEARYKNTYIAIIVGDSETEETFNNNCNQCCGDAAGDMSSALMPVFALEASICANAAGNRIISKAYPSGAIKVVNSFNNAPHTTAPSPSYVSAAAFVTWANSNWSSMGTWTNDAVNGIINLTLANGITSAGFTIYV